MRPNPADPERTVSVAIVATRLRPERLGKLRPQPAKMLRSKVRSRGPHKRPQRRVGFVNSAAALTDVSGPPVLTLRGSLSVAVPVRGPSALAGWLAPFGFEALDHPMKGSLERADLAALLAGIGFALRRILSSSMR
jgi:hypothetical protein